MEVDVSYTGIFTACEMVLVSSGRLEYIPTVVSASPPAVPETSSLRKRPVLQDDSEGKGL
jgi:hypothetical protein